MSNPPAPATRAFLSVADLDPAQITDVLARAVALKAGSAPGAGVMPLAGRSVALMFQKPSLRTRVSFEVGISRLGATPVVLVGEEVGLGSREVPRDVARTLDRYVDAIVARVFDHSLLEDLAAASRVPVINALSDAEHPCQALADLMALAERWGSIDALAGRQLAYVGDGNNVAASLLLAGASVGLHVRIASPEGYELDPRIVHRARHIAEETGARIELTTDPVEAVRGADAVYTDVWASMGQEEQAERRREVFRPYAVTRQLLEGSPDALVMHCLPAHRGDEITSEVLDGPRSIVFDQAGDRLWVQMALLLRLMRPDLG
jgi:ornithine carbamoyltransferase